MKAGRTQPSEAHPLDKMALLPVETDVAILGAGPIGLDAALAMAHSGRDFVLLEAGPTPAAGIRSWGNVRLFSPWSLNLSERMRSCLAEHREQGPSALEDFQSAICPTGHQLCERALDPLAQSPQLSSRLYLQHRVMAVGRENLIKREEIGTERRAAQAFRLLVDAPNGERLLRAKVVLDCTGSQHQPLWLGASGIPAPGELKLTKNPGRRLTRSLGGFFELLEEPQAIRGQRLLLVGAGHSAQTAAVALAAVADDTDTQVTWIVRGAGEVSAIDDDPLPERSALQVQAGKLLNGTHPKFEIHRWSTVDAIRTDPESLTVTIRTLADGGSPGSSDPSFRDVEVDGILSLVGAVGDHSLYRELQVQECYATSGPMRLAAALLGEADPDNAGDCMAQVSQGAETLLTPEPGYFILGNKSYGRNSAFLLRIGYQQVDDVLSLIDEP